MAERAYIALDAEQRWTLYWGDGSEDVRQPLVVGQEFREGAAIRAAVEALVAWAEANGYQVTPPRYSTQEIALEDVIERDVYDEVAQDDADV